MRSVEEHLDAVLALGHRLDTVEVTGLDALGLVLADDLTASLAVPPYANSAMDGFAVRSADVSLATTEQPVSLAVQGDLPAGAFTDLTLGPGQAMRIMTGAPVPPGADSIVPVELTDQPRGAAPLPTRIEVRAAVSAGQHVRGAGDDSAVGDLVASAGTLLTPTALSSLVSTGHAHLRAVRRPRVWVISSGSELVAPGVVPGPGQIPDSNGWLLAGLLRQFGADVVAVERVDDDPARFAARLAEGVGADLVVTTGGVSVGAFEVIRQVTERPDGSGVTFHQVAMQPGKPQGAGTVLQGGVEVPLLALPGNPVSVFVSAWLFVRPLVATMAGRPTDQPVTTAPAGSDWRTPAGRRQYLPAVLDDGRVQPVHRLGSGSHLVAALHRARVLAVVDAGVDEVHAGDPVGVIDVTRGVW